MSNAKSSGRRDAMFFFGGGRGCGWRWAAVGKRHSKSNYEPTLRQQEQEKQEKQQEKQQQSQRGLGRGRESTLQFRGLDSLASQDLQGWRLKGGRHKLQCNLFAASLEMETAGRQGGRGQK